MARGRSRLTLRPRTSSNDIPTAKHMLVDLREAWTHTLPIVIKNLASTAPRYKIAIRLGPRAFRTAQSETASQLDHCCLAPTASFWDAQATDHWECHYNGSAKSYLRMGRTFALHLLALDALPDGQTLKWQASQKGLQSMLRRYPPKSGGLALWGSSIFRLWESPAHFSEHNVTNLAFGGAPVGKHCTTPTNSFPCSPAPSSTTAAATT